MQCQVWINDSFTFVRAVLSCPQDLAHDIRDSCGDWHLKAHMEKLINLLIPVIKVLCLCSSGADACAVA